VKELNVSGKTQVCGVIGDPIEHTMSPAMHNAAYEAAGIDFIYLSFRVASAELRNAMTGMRALGIKGLNVTIPHKVAVIPFLDKVDPLAEKIGAVNTVVNENGTLTGYNTDAMGFLRALVEHGTEPRGRKVLLLGAGGAARAIAHVLAEEGASLVILNRKEEFSWAQELARRIGDVYEIPVGVGELDGESIAQAIGDSDIVVNATSEIGRASCRERVCLQV
jgi:shikimate dehydrogenase